MIFYNPVDFLFYAIPVVLLAFILSAMIGVIVLLLSGQGAPVLWAFINVLIRPFGQKLNNLKRTQNDLFFRGVFLSLFVFGLYIFLWHCLLYSVSLFFGQEEGSLFIMDAPSINQIAVFWSESLFFSLCLSTGSVWFLVLGLRFHLGNTKSLKQNHQIYYLLARSLNRDLSHEDNHSISRHTVSFTAKQINKGLVAPVFWYLIGGIYGAILYSSMAAVAYVFGPDGHTRGFARFALLLEKLLGYFPALLSGIIISFAGLIMPGTNGLKGILEYFSFTRRIPYAQGGRPLQAMAGILNRSLGGPGKDLNGFALKSRWAGAPAASAKLSRSDLIKAFAIHILCVLILCLLLALILLFLIS